MKVLRYKLVSESELLQRLKETRLKGFDQPLIYQQATLEIVEQVNTDLLVPPQRYVLKATVDSILELADDFEVLGIDIFSLRGGILFWLEGSDPEKDLPIPLLPPIVEESTERDGKVVQLINDGMHRVMSARKRGRGINIVSARNVPTQYPYYAYAFQGGWGEVKEFEELPDEFQKKDYRNPDNYKALFRNFNAVFAGVQQQRKQSNPSHIKE